MRKSTGSRKVAVTPVWAQQIQVERRKDSLLITGWNHFLFHLDGRVVDPVHLPKLDLLAKLRHYMLRNLKHRAEEAQDVGFYQFTEATDDEKLISFVESFGPFWGRIVEREGADEFMAPKLIVRQDLAELRWHQSRFAAAVRLLRELNRREAPQKMADAWREMIIAMMTIYPVPSAYMPKKGVPAAIAKLAALNKPGTIMSTEQPWLWSYLALAELASDKSEGRAGRIMEYAHRALCNLLNERPLMLIPAEGTMPVEMPCLQAQGIAGALYYRLRLDYLAGREVGTCLNCGCHFPVKKRGTRGCTPRCRRALKNFRYWSSNSKKINKDRRQKNNKKPR
jgi:hypothetical protein